MPKTKYRYNPETLSYEEVKLTTKDKIFRSVLVVLPALLFMVIGGILTASFLTTPEEKDLEHKLSNYELERRQALEALNKKVKMLGKVVKNIKERDKNLLRVTYGMDSYPEYLSQPEFNIDRYKEFETDELILYTAQRIDSLQYQLYAQSVSYDEVEQLAMSKKDMLVAVPSIQPINNKDLTRIASGFGMRVHPVYQIPKMHTGIDMTADIGTEIYATGNGVIEKVDWVGGYGKLVIIDHGFGYKTYYAHCSTYNVKEGQKVRRGEVIAFVGNSGISTGPHLHYEVRKKVQDVTTRRFYYKPIDPVHYFYNDLSPEEYKRVIEIASKATHSLS